MADCYIVRRGGAENAASVFPEFTYTGTYTLIDEGIVDGVQNWHIKFLTSGNLILIKAVEKFDIFLVGGGGGGGGNPGSSAPHGGGGGGGYNTTQYDILLNTKTDYQIIIGDGGSKNEAGNGGRGGTTSGFGLTAAGGYGGVGYTSVNWGATTTHGSGGVYQGAFGDAETYGKYSRTASTDGVVNPNTGDGGFGSNNDWLSKAGASGIVIIRNARISN